MWLRQAVCQSRTLQEKFVSQNLPVWYRDSHGAVTYSLPIPYTPGKALGTAKWLQRTLCQSRTCQVCFTEVASVVSVPHTWSCQETGVAEGRLDWTIQWCLKSSSRFVCFKWVCVCSVCVCAFQKKCVFSDRDFLLDYTVRFLLGGGEGGGPFFVYGKLWLTDVKNCAGSYLVIHRSVSYWVVQAGLLTPLTFT